MDGKKHQSGTHHDQDGWPCFKCERNFATQSQREHHKYYSKNHILCLYCPESEASFEFDTEEALHEHCIRTHGKEYCNFCRDHQTAKWSGWLHWHRREHKLGRGNICLCGVSLDSIDDMEKHLRTSMDHKHTYCRYCKRNFATADARAWHLEHECDRFMGSLPFLGPRKPVRHQPSNAGRPRLYEIIGVDQSCSQHEVLKAAKQMRIENHPDRLKRRGGLSVQEMMAIDARAQEVGHAADILSNLASRSRYDMDVLTGRAA